MTFETAPRIFINIDDHLMLIEAYNMLMLYYDDENELYDTVEYETEDELENAKDMWFDYIFGYGDYAY